MRYFEVDRGRVLQTPRHRVDGGTVFGVGCLVAVIVIMALAVLVGAGVV